MLLCARMFAFSRAAASWEGENDQRRNCDDWRYRASSEAILAARRAVGRLEESAVLPTDSSRPRVHVLPAQKTSAQIGRPGSSREFLGTV